MIVNIFLLGLLALTGFFLFKHEKKYDQMFGVGSARFVLGEITIVTGVILILVLIRLSYNLL